MKALILQARPAAVALAGLVPFSIALVSHWFIPGNRMLFAAAVYLGLAMVLGWCWVVGNSLNARLSLNRRPPSALFRFSVCFCAAYFAYFLFGSGFLLARSPVLFLALHVTAMAAMLKVLHFVGLNLSLVEDDLSRPADSSWSTTFALFSIAGTLPVQRRINRIFRGI